MIKESNVSTLHFGDGFLMKPVLAARDIPVTDIYTRYSRGSKKWYSRTHLARIVNGKRPIPVELAKDIAEVYNFSWTDFYEVAENKMKTVDAVPCKTHDMRVIFKPQIQRFYCPADYVDSHYAIWADQEHPQTTYFGNQIRSIHLFNKNKTELSVDNLSEAMAHPILIQNKKDKDWYCGFLTGHSTPVMQTDPHIHLADIYNTRNISFKVKELSHFHYLDHILCRPKLID